MDHLFEYIFLHLKTTYANRSQWFGLVGFVGFGGLGPALVGSRSGGDLLEQRTEHLATSLNFFNIKTLKD